MDDNTLRAHARWVADTARASREAAAGALDATATTAAHQALLVASEDAANHRAGAVYNADTLDAALAAGGQLQRDAMDLRRELSHLLDVLADMTSRSLAVLGDAEPRDVYDLDGNYLGKVSPAAVRR